MCRRVFTLEKAKTILDELKAAGVVEVTFTGGEILAIHMR